MFRKSAVSFRFANNWHIYSYLRFEQMRQSAFHVLQLPNSRGQNHDRDTYNLQHERDMEFNELRVTLWHDAPGMADNVFLGEVRIPLRGPQEQQFAASNKW
jgi:hypothetical protein